MENQPKPPKGYHANTSSFTHINFLFIFTQHFKFINHTRSHFNKCQQTNLRSICALEPYFIINFYSGHDLLSLKIFGTNKFQLSSPLLALILLENLTTYSSSGNYVIGNKSPRESWKTYSSKCRAEHKYLKGYVVLRLQPLVGHKNCYNIDIQFGFLDSSLHHTTILYIKMSVALFFPKFLLMPPMEPGVDDRLLLVTLRECLRNIFDDICLKVLNGFFELK